MADCAAIGSIMMPAMMKEGYGKSFAVAVNANAAIVAPIIRLAFSSSCTAC